MGNNNKWKDYFLKSGVPLEYEVKKLLDIHNCQTKFEHSYLRKDRADILTEFSYDLNSVYIDEMNFFELMIECKYRDPSTNWIFLPDGVSNKKSLSLNSILHPNDHFTIENKYNFEIFEMPYLAQVGSKGIEITSDGQNPKSITQAINQLSYGMSKQYVDSMIEHLESNNGIEDLIFYHIPIIVTTANLYLLNEDVSIDSIKKSNDINDIAKKQTDLIINCNIGKDLENYNYKMFSRLFERFDKSYLKKRFKSKFDDIEMMISVLSRLHCPSSIYVVQHNSGTDSFKKLFELIDEVIFPTNKTIRFMKDKNKKAEFKKEYLKRKNADKDLPF